MFKCLFLFHSFIPRTCLFCFTASCSVMDQTPKHLSYDASWGLCRSGLCRSALNGTQQNSLTGNPSLQRTTPLKHLGFGSTSARSWLTFSEENRKVQFSPILFFFLQKNYQLKDFDQASLKARQDGEGRNSDSNNQAIHMQGCTGNYVNCLLYFSQPNSHSFAGK